MGWDDRGPAKEPKLGLETFDIVGIAFSFVGVCGGVSSCNGAGIAVPSVREYWIGRIEMKGA